MPTSTLTTFDDLAEQIGKGVHNFASHTFKLALSNTAPNAATHQVKADLAEISTGNGYAGPIDVAAAYTESGGTGTLTATDQVVTAAGGSVGPFRYVVLYNDTPTSPADPLIGWWDYGSSITLLDTETFTIDFSSSVLTIT